MTNSGSKTWLHAFICGIYARNPVADMLGFSYVLISDNPIPNSCGRAGVEICLISTVTRVDSEGLMWISDWGDKHYTVLYCIV